MRKLTPPNQRVPIGVATINGQAVDVYQHPEFVRFFFDLFNRVGGTESASTTDLSNLLDAERLWVFQPRQAPDSSPDIGYINAFGTRPPLTQEQLSIPQVAAFMPRRQEQSTPLADAGAVICSRVFRAR